jgi:hypothetical protein
MKHYLLIVWGDLDPEIMGPFDTVEFRDRRAREIRKARGDKDGIYTLSAAGKVEVDSYAGSFFEEGT